MTAERRQPMPGGIRLTLLIQRNAGGNEIVFCHCDGKRKIRRQEKQVGGRGDAALD